MTTANPSFSHRINHNALLPRLVAFCAKQWKAWKLARRMERADELAWNMALQDARMMADLSRAMDAGAAQR